MAMFIQSNSWVLYFIIIVCLIFFGIGISMLINLTQHYGKLKQSKNWLSTNGKIISSDLDAHISTDDDGYQTTTYLAKVNFTYEVSGRTYKSDRVNFDYGMRTSNVRKPQSVVEQYPSGSDVTVYYDPEDPQQSVLEKRVNGAFTTIMVSAVFIGIGVIVAVTSLGVNPPEFIKNLLGR